jgi:hypothetical protein
MPRTSRLSLFAIIGCVCLEIGARIWISGHGQVMGGSAAFPYNSPRVCLDPMDFNPQTGEITCGLTWKPQMILFDPQRSSVKRARQEPLGSVLDNFGKP